MTSITRHKGKILKNSFEKNAWINSLTVCGIDEVGRGCLAGPVVTAAAILPINKASPLLKDSKLMTHEERLAAAQWIKKNCAYSYGIVHHRFIDQQNIWRSTMIAMKKALMNLLANVSQLPSAILVDAMPLNLIDTHFKEIPVHCFSFGERRSSSIAAASILAKLKRDEILTNLESIFPGYGLGQHKGYATELHRNAITCLNRTIIHRQSFLKNLQARSKLLKEEQQPLFSTKIVIENT